MWRIKRANAFPVRCRLVSLVAVLVAATSPWAKVVDAQTPSETSLTSLPAVVQRPAPLGLRFGMQPQQIPFATIVAPASLEAPGRPPSAPALTPTGQAGRIVAPPPETAGPISLFASGQSPGTARVSQVSRTSAAMTGPRSPASEQPGWTTAYIAACEAAFDKMADLGADAADWLAWRARHLKAGEGWDFMDALAERGRVATDFVSAEARRILNAHRSAGLYRVDGVDGRRAVCLLFTAQGLAHVFIAGDALIGIRDPIISELSGRSRLAAFSFTREAARFSLSLSHPACGVYCRLFGERVLVQRQIWLDQTARVLVTTKRAAIVEGLGGAMAASGLLPEVPDGLPESFVASTDLSRRAQMLRTMLMPRVPSAIAPKVPTVPGATGPGTSRAVSAPAVSSTVSPPRLEGMSRQTVVESFVP